MRTLFFALLCCVLATPALAGHPAGTDDAGTVDVGMLEVEASSARYEADGSSCEGYGLAVRRGLLARVDGGVALECLADRETSFGLAFDSKVRLNEGLVWRPATFVRADAELPAVGDGGSLEWSGFGVGATWGFARRELSLEWTGVMMESSLDPVGVGLVWYEAVSSHWTLALEANAAPFVDGDVPQSAMFGVIRDFGVVGALSFGFRVAETADAWDDTEFTVGLTR